MTEAALRALREAEDAFFLRYRMRVSRTETTGPDGGRVRVLEWGTGPPLVMLHGLGVLSSHWAPLVAHLRDRRCIAIDLPGIALSDPIPLQPETLRSNMVDFLSKVVENVAAEKVSVVGSSYGGMCSLWLAAERPDIVHSLAFLGAPGVVLPATGTSPSALVAHLPAPAWAARVLRPPHEAWTRLVLGVALGRRGLKRLPPEAVSITHAALQIPAVREEMWRLVRMLARPGAPGTGRIVAAPEELHHVATPCLFVWGSKDVYLRPARAERAIGTLPQAQLVVIEGGHAPWFDNAARCAQLIRSFVGEVGACSQKRDARGSSRRVRRR